MIKKSRHYKNIYKNIYNLFALKSQSENVVKLEYLWAKKNERNVVYLRFCIKKGSHQKLPQSLLVPPFSRQCRAVSIFGYAFFSIPLMSKSFRSFLRQCCKFTRCSDWDFFTKFLGSYFLTEKLRLSNIKLMKDSLVL